VNLTLEPSERIRVSPGPLLLVVMDGVGVGRQDEFDAVHLARTPTLDRLRESAPYRTLVAHGKSVGLPSDADMGNSEVCHNALGAGRVFNQGAKLVNEALDSGALFEGEVWTAVMERCVGAGAALHLIGLLSDGNVHSHEKHLHAMIEEADRRGVTELYVHALLDGRDVPPTSALIYVDRLEEVLSRARAKPDRRYLIASGGGRMQVTMDRYEADWEIVRRGWEAHVHGEARSFATTREAIETFREEKAKAADQFLPAFVIAEEGTPVGRIKDADAVLFFNFRGDRALEISRAFEEGEGFDKFDRGARPDVFYAGMTLYDGDFGIPQRYLVPPPGIERTVGAYLAAAGVTQLALSETQKYGHVTYFWNGNRGGKFDEATETYIEIPSDAVPFEERPWMKAAEITDRTIEALQTRDYRFLRINYPNGDMVGHSGDLQATVLAVEIVDLCLARLIPVIDALQGTLIVLADHGNADDMVKRDKQGRPLYDEDGAPKWRTSHSLNAIPFQLYAPAAPELRLRDDLPDAGIAHVTATLLELLGYRPPQDYLGSLLE